MKLSKEDYGRAVGFVEWLAWSNRNDMDSLEKDFKDETLLYILYNMEVTEDDNS